MKKYENLSQITENEIVEDLKSCLDESDHHFNFKLTTGGLVYVVESKEEIDTIKNSNGLGLKEDMAGFDINELTDNGGFRVLYSANNNAGGDTYYIPVELYNAYH